MPESLTPAEADAIRIMWEKRGGDPGQAVPPAIQRQYLAEIRERQAEVEREALRLLEQKVSRRGPAGSSSLLKTSLLVILMAFAILLVLRALGG